MPTTAHGAHTMVAEAAELNRDRIASHSRDIPLPFELEARSQPTFPGASRLGYSDRVVFALHTHTKCNANDSWLMGVRALSLRCSIVCPISLCSHSKMKALLAARLGQWVHEPSIYTGKRRHLAFPFPIRPTPSNSHTSLPLRIY